MKRERRGTPRDMTAANWARTLARLRRNMAELRDYGVRVSEPEGFDIPPERRIANTSPERA